MPVPLAVPGAIILSGFLDWMNQGNSNDAAVQAQTEALNKAQGAIQTGADKAMSYQQPYLQNAGADYAKQRGLVQGGYYQTPYNKSFQGQSYAPSGFNFNPSQGSASFAPWKPQGGAASYTPPSLPSQAGYAPQQPQTPVQAQPQVPQGKDPRDINALMKMAYEMMHAVNPQQLPNGATTLGPPGGIPGGGLLNYNPQTGQGNPLEQIGAKPADPRFPTQQIMADYLKQNPWAKGQSGPLEGGMNTGLFGRR